uniref:Uncharacterized protein n=1 Tax=Cannabis sativa TaxID=3483 RepID=A0A803Q3I1_CANSA
MVMRRVALSVVKILIRLFISSAFASWLELFGSLVLSQFIVSLSVSLIRGSCRFRIYLCFELWEAHNHAFHYKVVPNAIGVLCKIKKCLACLSAFGGGVPWVAQHQGTKFQLSSSDPLEAETLALSQVVSLCMSRGWHDCFDFDPTRHQLEACSKLLELLDAISGVKLLWATRAFKWGSS